LRSLDSPAGLMVPAGAGLGDWPGSPHPRLGQSETSLPKSWREWTSCTMPAWFGSRPTHGATTCAPLPAHVQKRSHAHSTKLFAAAHTPDRFR
jgi:hypothetical protein